MAIQHSKSRGQLSPRIFLAILVCVGFASGAMAHEFERGQIERSFEAVVRGDVVTVHWRVGMSGQTMADMLLAAKSVTAKEHEQLLAQLAKEDAETGDAETEDAETTTESTDDSTPKKASMLETENGLSERVEQELLAQWASKIAISFDGKPAKFTSVQSQKSSRHHVNFECQFKAKVPATGKHTLSIADSNFLELLETEESQSGSFLYHGGVRKALRAKGSAVLLNSAVAPVLSRSTVSESSGLDLAGRVELCTLNATVVIVAKKKPASSTVKQQTVK